MRLTLVHSRPVISAIEARQRTANLFMEAALMAKNELTSKKVASTAGKLLAEPKTPKAVKTVAGSALTQAPNKPKKSK